MYIDNEKKNSVKKILAGLSLATLLSGSYYSYKHPEVISKYQYEIYNAVVKKEKTQNQQKQELLPPPQEITQKTYDDILAIGGKMNKKYGNKQYIDKLINKVIDKDLGIYLGYLKDNGIYADKDEAKYRLEVEVAHTVGYAAALDAKIPKEVKTYFKKYFYHAFKVGYDMGEVERNE